MKFKQCHLDKAIERQSIQLTIAFFPESTLRVNLLRKTKSIIVFVYFNLVYVLNAFYK